MQHSNTLLAIYITSLHKSEEADCFDSTIPKAGKHLRLKFRTNCHPSNCWILADDNERHGSHQCPPLYSLQAALPFLESQEMTSKLLTLKAR